MNPPTQLSLRNIQKSFPGKEGLCPVLGGLTFDIYKQDFVSIIGPSGCGKTTIFNILAGLVEPEQGEIRYEGEPVRSLRGRVGYMLQKDLLMPWRTVLQNVLLGLEMRRPPLAEAMETAREYLNRFGLGGFENAYPRTLSGGMRQPIERFRGGRRHARSGALLPGRATNANAAIP